MKVVRFHEYGGSDVLKYEEADAPTPGRGQVRVRVVAAAFNPADAGIRGGYLQEPFPVELPHVPGYDVSGVVDSLGEGVTGVAVGDAVVAFLSMTDDGASAQFVLAPVEALVTAPTRIPLVDAAALPSAGITAWQSLFDSADLQAGQRVLINGAGGSVGRLAVQLALGAGAHVVAATTGESLDQLRAAGVHEVIDYAAGAVTVGDPVDVLLNLGSISPDALQALVDQVRPGGVVVNTVPSLPTPGDPARDVRGVAFFVHSDTADLAQLVAMVDRGELEVEIAERLPLSDLATVHARSDAGELTGKVILLPPSE